MCRKIADKTQHIVVSVDYRLAPEHPYPAGLTDAYCTAEHLWGLLEKHTIKTTRHLTIAGDSGGGAMAATITQIATEQKAFSINRQVLIYPSLDYTMSQPSLEENGHGYLLTRETVTWYFDHYFKHQENREHASPLWLPIDSNYPSTLLLTAEFCPLRDEGFAFVEKLKHAHVQCAHVHFEDMIHAFMNMEDLTPKACEKLYSSIADFVVKGTS
ncbi:alpha/beta hydrolase [Veronia nyctiphanis]|uniref:alpha/beta hydrolase n=1 Tax=Veronia nyctiphanis TaxID=1278244 RepID=UPI002E26E346